MKEITVKSVLNKKKNRDAWFLDEYTLNPYEGCSFNCQYCYVRGSKYGENMAETLAVKANALQILDRQLAFRARKQQQGIIALASATDPYLKAEEQLGLTRGCLSLIHRHRFPVLVITRSPLVLRDVDLLKAIANSAVHAPDLVGRLPGALVSFSFSTLDEAIAATLEPGAPPPRRRLEAMQQCKEAGLTVGMHAMPVLPFISDTDAMLDQLVATARDYKADYVLIGGLTLFGHQPADSKVLYYKFLERCFPPFCPATGSCMATTLRLRKPTCAICKTVATRAVKSMASDRGFCKHFAERILLFRAHSSIFTPNPVRSNVTGSMNPTQNL